MKPASTLPRFLLPLLLCLVTVTVGGDDSPATASSIRVNGSANGAVSPAGDVDYWRVNVPSAGQLVVETTGDTDTTGALEDRDGNLLQEHDDQDVNTNRNFKIERAVTASVYYIRISAYRNSTGDYTLRVRHTPESGGGAGGGDMGPAGARVAVSHALGDLNGDGNDDVLLRHTDGRWLYYPMNGREYLAGRRATANLTRDLNRRVVTGTNATQGNQGGGNDDGDTDTGAPDLVVESPSVSDSTLAPGDTFSLNVRVRNQGDARSGSTTLRYYRSTNSTVNSSDTQVGADSVAGLSGGGNRSISETLVAPSGPGTYYYGACVDSVNGESNAGNNCSRGIRVRVEAEQTPGAPDSIFQYWNEPVEREILP